MRLWFASHASTNRGIRIVSLAFAALMVADLATQYRLAHATAAGQLAPIRWIEVLYALFGVLVAAGAMNADATRRPPGDSLTTTVERSRILALLIVAMLVPTLVVLILSEQLGTYGPLFVLGLVGLLTILMSLRISLLLFDYGNLVTRGRTLTRATDAIADATTPAELDAMAPAWVAALAAQSPHAPWPPRSSPTTSLPMAGGAASESRLTAEFPIGGTGGHCSSIPGAGSMTPSTRRSSFSPTNWPAPMTGWRSSAGWWTNRPSSAWHRCCSSRRTS